MPIPSQILALIDRLNQELEQTERDATEGLNLVRQRLSRFPDNVVLTQFFAALSNILLFVEIYRGRIQSIVDRISPENVASEIIQEAGEDLGIILGRVLEVKINANRLKTRLEN
ncbi:MULTISPECIES: hypothetical protein [Argonema]|uniref:hypothetical protein n=1 Tax=Argonema TaxID=2942761 RepID=UPI002013813F|nr:MULTISPECIES: hypothetical protein [Argonema]MCL1463182.1 hypothetical protein [Argonema galeatum A003/A1]MCL1470274.1 hypothetical protein [Argonema antarcticum A004/B2]